MRQRFLRFSAVGILSSGISLVVYNIVFALTGRLPLAMLSGILAGAANGAVGHRKWTFHDRKTEPAASQTLRFLAVTAVSCVIGTFVSAAVIAWWPFGTQTSDTQKTQLFWTLARGSAARNYSPLRANVAAIAGGLVSLGWSYTLSNRWAFRR